VLRIPIARIIGTTTYTFEMPKDETSAAAASSSGETSAVEDVDDGSGSGSSGRLVLRRQKESLSVVPLFLAERVSNRRITRDTILFFDTRRPPLKPTQDWDEKVWDSLRASSVPGMKQLDIDGLSSEDSAQVYEDVTIVLTFITFCVIVLGSSIGWLYFKQLHQESAFMELTDYMNGDIMS
jgi:hypothetical protein